MSGSYDAFEDLAPYYDHIMEHVNYGRWFHIAEALSAMLPRGFTHVDTACGTGVLIKRLRAAGWRSFGVDLSFAMIRAGKRGPKALPAATADLRALPLHGGADYVTCLFDSLNFLLERDDVLRAFREVHGALSPQGLFYFDIVTERMVKDYFDGQEWTEQNGRFSTTWRSAYSRKTSVVDTRIRVNSGASGAVRERVYSQKDIERALGEAGFHLLGVFDAHSWRAPGRKSIRLDFVAVKPASRALRKQFDGIVSEIRRNLV
ncbi:MAG: class I SAM-dependent methyltransferase [Candidatus Hydrogenedentes bacterium]|nr:class I SAM-dependent methyltransferase [Candidatus Hydrogenedentota bacterium]